MSFLGQPLRVVVPLLGATGDSLEERCFRVLTPYRNDGLAVVAQARIELQTSTNPPLLIVRSARAVDDPIVHMTIEAGCDNPIRRGYTILLDPPPLQSTEVIANRGPSIITSPLAVDGSVTASSVTVDPANLLTPKNAGRTARSQSDRSSVVRSASSTASADKRKSRPMTTSLRRASKPEIAAEQASRVDTKPVQPQQDQLRVQDGSSGNFGGFGGVGDPSLAALAVPRLKIASDFQSFEAALPGDRKITDELQAAIAGDRRARLLSAPIEEDLAPRLEADLVVARRRLAELQSQLTAAGLTPKSEPLAASGAAPVELAAVKVGPTKAATQSEWIWREWVWIPGVLLVVGLLGFLWRQKRAQSEAQGFATVAAPTIPLDDDRFEPTQPFVDSDASSVSLLGPIAAARLVATQTQTPSPAPAPDPAMVNPLLRTPAVATAEREASDRLNNPLFQLRDTTHHVDVSELSQVTDEAQVYVDLGRSDQAIDILRDHIAQQEGGRDSPAAWLMIFDLYRRTNNRAGYDELAPKFRTHFNGRMPDWDNYGHELALDDGLEAFPHLVAVIQRDWGNPEARKFLEELLYDNRGGSRLGFSLAAYRDILLLMQVHDAFDGDPPGFATMDWESRGANDDDGTPKWDLSLDMLEPAKVGELESFLRNRPPDDRT